MTRFSGQGQTIECVKEIVMTQPGSSNPNAFEAGINEFSDWTEEERNDILRSDQAHTRISPDDTEVDGDPL